MCFSAPEGLCKEIDATVARFWWAGPDKDRGLHWINWKDMGRPKKVGGMGFRNFKDFNLALLAKQCWCLIHDPDLLWLWVVKGRYFPNVSFMEAKKGSRASWAWASLLEGRDVILKGARWQIMGGQEVRFWRDNWVSGLPAGHPSPPLLAEANDDYRVVEFIDPISREWKMDLLSDLVPETVCGAISQIHVGHFLSPDNLVWPLERNGSYSVKSGYRWCKNRLPQSSHDRPSSSRSIDSRVELDLG